MRPMSDAIKEAEARRAGGRERTVTVGQLITIIDNLGSAQTRCAALNMASEALVKDHRDAVRFLANDADEVIQHAIEALQTIIDAEGDANG